MDVHFQRKEKIVGTFVVIVIFLLIATLVFVGRGKQWFETYVTFYTTFNESYNLQENAAVKLYKTDIGNVKKITLVEDKVKVKLAILERYANKFRNDTVVTVESPTFIGSEYVSVIPGSTDAGQVPEGGMIKSQAKKSISDVLEEFQVEKTAKMLIGAIQDLSQVAEMLRDPKGPLFQSLENISKTLAHIEVIVHDVKDGKGSLGEVLRSRELVKSVERSLSQIEVILKDISDASTQLPKAMGQAQDDLEIFYQIGDGVSESVKTLDGILKEIDANMVKVNVILTNLEKGSYDVPQVTETARLGIEEIREGVENIDKVVKSLQRNIFIQPNLPPEPLGKNTDAGLRN